MSQTITWDSGRVRWPGSFLLPFLITFIAAQSYAFTPLEKWVKVFGGGADDTAYSTVLDNAGNAYVLGTFQVEADLDPGPGEAILQAAGVNDLFVLKLNPNGNLLWVKRVGGTENVTGRVITLDADANILITGSFTGTADFDPGPGEANLTSAGSSDAFVLKLDTDGTYLWARRFGSATDDAGTSVAADASGNVHVTGYYEGTVDFDPGPGTVEFSSTGLPDSFILKLSADGDLVWARRLQGIPSGDDQPADESFSIAVDSQGNAVLTGWFVATVDFDPGPDAVTLVSTLTLYDVQFSRDMFVLKLDSNGDFVWVKAIAGPNNDEGLALCADEADNIYVTGGFVGQADFDPSDMSTYYLLSSGGYDYFVLKLNAAGAFQWAVRSGGSETNDSGCSICLDPFGNVAVAGVFDAPLLAEPTSASFYLVSDRVTSQTRQFGLVPVPLGTVHATYAVDTDQTGNLYLAGLLQGTLSLHIDHDESPTSFTSGGGTDICLRKVNYIPTGSLQVIIKPKTARKSGARWRLDDSLVWRKSGYTLNDVLAGDHVVKFKPLTGWRKVKNKSVTILESQTTIVKKRYRQE